MSGLEKDLVKETLLVGSKKVQVTILVGAKGGGQFLELAFIVVSNLTFCKFFVFRF